MLSGLRLQIHLSAKRPQKALILACGFIFIPCYANAKDYNYGNKEINQQDAMGYGSNNYYNGSGDSKDEGVRNGMRALNRLASLDIGGAFHYGYKGYDNYINSQKMDDLDAQAWKLKGVMSSVNDSMISGSSNSAGQSSNPGTSIGPVLDQAKTGRPSNKMIDMDRAFLYRGETGEVAAEFEKRSGMSREEFFNQLASAGDAGLSWDDPNLMDKFEQRYQAFVAKIPNEEYRNNLEKAHSLITMAKKTQLMQEAAAFYAKNRWGVDGAPQQVAKNDLTGNGNLAGNSNSGGGNNKGDGDRSPASSDLPMTARQAKTDDTAPKLSKEQMGMYLGLEGSHADELRDVMGSMLGGDSDSLFKIVSKRYRKLTPALIGKAVVMEAK